MAITVRYFASLTDYIGRTKDVVEVEKTLSISELWQRVTNDKKLPENTLAAVNMEYVSFEHRVVDGDEVAFFPPVTGG